MKTIFQFLFATYLFSKGFRKASRIAAALHIHPILICKWAKTPFWGIGIRFWGCTTKDNVIGIAKCKKKQLVRLQQARLEKEKLELRRQNGCVFSEAISIDRPYRSKRFHARRKELNVKFHTYTPRHTPNTLLTENRSKKGHPRQCFFLINTKARSHGV